MKQQQKKHFPVAKQSNQCLLLKLLMHKKLHFLTGLCSFDLQNAQSDSIIDVLELNRESNPHILAKLSQ